MMESADNSLRTRLRCVADADFVGRTEPPPGMSHHTISEEPSYRLEPTLSVPRRLGNDLSINSLRRPLGEGFRIGRGLVGCREQAYAAVKLRAIGVSKIERIDLDNILDNGAVKPMVNQVLAHVDATAFDLIDHSQRHDVLVEAYSPVGHGAVLNNRALADIAQRIWRQRRSTMYPILLATRSATAAQDGQRCAHARHCHRGLRHPRRGRADPEERALGRTRRRSERSRASARRSGRKRPQQRRRDAERGRKRRP